MPQLLPSHSIAPRLIAAGDRQVTPFEEKILRLLAFIMTLALLGQARADVSVRDDTGQEIRLVAPAKRIVTLAPHAAELVFAAGAGDRLVGTVSFSDYPPAAKKVTQVGGYDKFDLEAIAALKPDLIIAWQSGNPPAQVERLKALGYTVFVQQPDHLEDVARHLEALGQLAGTEGVANVAAVRFRERLAALRAYSAKPPVRVFYQVWKSPLMTVGGSQIISDVIHLCGGENVFGNLTTMAPAVSVEAVLETNPEVIVVSGMGQENPEWLDDWKKWKTMTAVRRGNLFFINPQLIQRHTPRILDGAQALCADLDAARNRRQP